jgi:hypothetical protein
MGSEDEAEQSFGRPCRQCDGRSKRKYELTSSIVPRGTSFHRKVELEFPPIGSDRSRCHAAAATCSRVQRNSVPSTQMRCMITANRRAKALADGGGGHVLHWTVSDEGDRFRKQAEDCRQKAERAVSPHDRDFWLRLAADWTKLPQSAEDRHRF